MCSAAIMGPLCAVVFARVRVRLRAGNVMDFFVFHFFAIIYARRFASSLVDLFELRKQTQGSLS